ncbi:probable G-protein coupled receptor B0563.6 [Pecten maximus]|uniref:probable G-protein coupled receptor B0563.6 n=1 Tax=Pecten maximus TaxID=6579 RepID=UPI0014585D74|nr:probable G-protein coupled receptor B0563.6 [Pecten maximus]
MNENMNATGLNAIAVTATNESDELSVSGDFISNATLQTIMKATYSGVIPTMAVVGLVFNVFSFVLLCPMKVRTSTNVYLIGLTVCDVWILLCGLAFCSMSILDLHDCFLAERIRILLVPLFVSYINPLPGSISNYLVTLIAVDRFVAVVFPLKVRVFCGRRFAIAAVIAAYVIPAIVSAPLAFLYENKEMNNTDTGEIVDTVSLTTFGKDKCTVRILNIAIEVVLRFTPVGLVAAASTGTIISLIYQSRKSQLRKHNLPAHTREIQVTKTILILTIVFLITNLPSAINRCVIFLRSDVYTAQRQDNLQWMLMVFWYICFIANSCINFPIYIIACKEYRQQFQKIMCSP